jgi:hypothetical protein
MSQSIVRIGLLFGRLAISPPVGLSIGTLDRDIELDDGADGVARRRVWSHDVSDLGPGEHVIHLADGGWLPAGVYLARLTQAGRAAPIRLALVH